MKERIKKLLDEAIELGINIHFIGHKPCEGTLGDSPLQTKHLGIDLRWTEDYIYEELKKKVYYHDGLKITNKMWIEEEYLKKKKYFENKVVN